MMLKTVNWQSLAFGATSHHILAQASCDPAVESCDAEEYPERPGAGGLISTMIISPFLESLTILLVSLVFGTSDAANATVSAVSYYITVSALAALYSPVESLVFIYLIFKDNLFLFAWVDTILGFYIEHVLSNLLPMLFFWLIFFVGTPAGFLNFLVHAYFWDRSMKSSVNAIRYMKPSWNKVEDGNRLWPSIAYLFGLAKYDSEKSEQSEQSLVAQMSDSNKKDSYNDANEVQNKVWTLMFEV